MAPKFVKQSKILIFGFEGNTNYFHCVEYAREWEWRIWVVNFDGFITVSNATRLSEIFFIGRGCTVGRRCDR